MYKKANKTYMEDKAMKEYQPMKEGKVREVYDRWLA